MHALSLQGEPRGCHRADERLALARGHLDYIALQQTQHRLVLHLERGHTKRPLRRHRQPGEEPGRVQHGAIAHGGPDGLGERSVVEKRMPLDDVRVEVTHNGDGTITRLITLYGDLTAAQVETLPASPLHGCRWYPPLAAGHSTLRTR